MKSIIGQWLGNRRIDKARIDIKNYGGPENDVCITVVNKAECQMISPEWFCRRERGKGYVVSTCARHILLNINCVKAGRLEILLRGIDIRSIGQRLPIFVDYTRFVVDGKEVFSAAATFSHDNKYTFAKDVADGEVLTVEIFWEAHSYTDTELDTVGREGFMEISVPPVWMLHSKVDLKKCIEILENSEENIYLLDKDGKYDWWSVCGANSKLQLNSIGEIQLTLKRIEPLCIGSPIDKMKSISLFSVCDNGYKKYPKIKELPIIYPDGRVVARVIRNPDKKNCIVLDWDMILAMNPKWPHQKIYVSSEMNSELQKFMNKVKNVVDVELMSKENLMKIFRDKDGILIYGKDIYPDIPKMSLVEFYQKMLLSLRFKINLQALKCYEGFHADLTDVGPSSGIDFTVNSCIESFLSQLESKFPVLLEDAYNIEELTWICDKLRSTDKYGSDNHLYLLYSSWKDFLKSLNTVDWTYVINTGKVVFLFSEEDKDKYYPKKTKYSKPKPLLVEEINELVDSIQRGYSGSDFFQMILDNHPSLLTVGWHGLSSYALVWKIFCEGKSVNDAIEHMKNPKTKDEKELLDVNLDHALKYNYEERREPFYTAIKHYLEDDKIYDLSDWFKAFFLAVNEIVGREFGQRIAPAIFYDRHGMRQADWLKKFKADSKYMYSLRKSVIDSFKHKKRIGIVRFPFTMFGSRMNSHMKLTKKSMKHPLWVLRRYTSGMLYGNYMEADSPELEISRQVRFEDLKLYPKETIKKMCGFLRITYSDSLFHLTTNGEDSGNVDGTVGFDPTPVYNPHPEHLSSFDYYRVELLNYKSYTVWGYKPKFYDGTKFSREDLKRLYDIPFKCEGQKLENYPEWPNEDDSRAFHEYILARAIDVMENGEKEPLDDKGNPMKLVECLYPDLKPGQKLFEN